MSYNDKNKDNIENDDMKIKSHLDASLDLSGISVSEDLINRTLDAIKKQAAAQPASNEEPSEKKIATEKDNKKVIPWNRYVRGFAGVAAAAIIVVAGYNMLSTAGYKSKSSNDSMVAQEQASDSAATEETTLDDSTMAAFESPESTAKSDGGATDNADTTTSDIASSNVTEAASVPQFSIAAGTTADSEGAGTSGSSDTNVKVSDASAKYGTTSDPSGANQDISGDTNKDAASSDTASLQMDQSFVSKDMESDTILTFRDIFLSEPDKADYITLTDELNGTVVTLTDEEAILEFYTVMDKHQFKYSTDSTEDSTEERNFTVEINNADVDATYLMTIGTYITVNYSDSVTTSQSYYNAVDSESLNQDLKDLIQKYSK